MSVGFSWLLVGPELVISWLWAGPDQELVTQDQHMTSLNQLKPDTMLQNIPNQHMLFFFNTALRNILNLATLKHNVKTEVGQKWVVLDWNKL